MPKLTIDGREITVEAGTTLMAAASRLGIEIPRYCYHPAFSVAGNCRMCLVEVEGNPKPVISCHTQCADGMVVHTNNERVRKLQQAVLEFLLINHPLDCPVCDQAGECQLQDYYLQFGLYDPRFNENKNRKSKAVPFGKHLMLDSERCILCSRCVRFTDEVTETHELGIFGRGERSQVGIAPGKTLDNPYSGNLADICPVGALTDLDFRFKCRVWYLKSQNSVCPGCSRGCNIRIDFNLERPHHGKGARVMRIKPRENTEVNQWWICDEGRYGYKFMDENRLTRPLHRKDGELKECSWDEALSGIAGYLKQLLQSDERKSIGVIPATHLTNEDFFALRLFFKDILELAHVDFELPVPDGEGDDFLRTSDKSPNTRGAREILGTGSVSAGDMVLKARKGNFKLLLVFGYDLKEIYGDKTCEELREKLGKLVFIGSNRNGTCDYADWVLPASVCAEKDGTFTNCEGRVQRIGSAFPSLAEAKPELEILRLLAKKLNLHFPYQNPQELFEDLTKVVPAFQGLNYAVIGDKGAILETEKGKKKVRKRS